MMIAMKYSDGKLPIPTGYGILLNWQEYAFFSLDHQRSASTPFQIMIILAVCTNGCFRSTKKERAGVLELSLQIEKNAHGSLL
ncbi:hypothetical protein [Ktedonobacter sp. SOSP1-85]|uniref:hypothetical protein n=1 Tax=Ktedonobacter sp. SOSP1-85 TaxID=2778367 RepID=UPI001F2F73CF|nr:hypothetical protein [Ktedonobacter sp. SOSP1-85]